MEWELEGDYNREGGSGAGLNCRDKERGRWTRMQKV